MNYSLINFVVTLSLALMYLPLIFFVIQRREEEQNLPLWLVIAYASLAMILNFTEALWKNNAGDAQGFQALQHYGILTLTVMMILTVKFFVKQANWWNWVGLWAFWVFGLALLQTNAFDFPETYALGKITLHSARLAPAWATLGWSIFVMSLALTIASASKTARQQLFRNRLNYWWPVFVLIFLNDLLFFANHPLTGNPLRFLAAVFMSYVVVTHNLPDVRLMLRRAFTYGLIALLMVGLYAAGFLLIEAIFGDEQNFNPLLAGAVISLILALLFAPLLNTIRRAVNAWLKADQYDPNRTIHQYSENISNILDMERLASIAVGIIKEAMQVQVGFLFLVDSDREADGRKIYRLRPATEERSIPLMDLEENGSIAAYFLREQKPLLQYDLDLLPIFRNSSAAARDWFNQLQTEVYIPIFAKRQWIGLLAFGGKTSGNRYSHEDLVTLSAHANQTAVALENARLVDNLMRLNNELRGARRQLEKNNHDLERIDQAKSDFISIASHELRTPLTVIKGYTEMLMEDGRIDENVQLSMKKIHEGTLRLHEVMDSMFDIAQIDARSLKPHLQLTALGSLIKETMLEQTRAIKERGQSIALELPALPYVKVDPNLLIKLFHHLIRNAIKFTPNGGKITISGHAIPAIMDLPNGGVEIIFSDTGVGVDPNYREIIFTKFYQPSELGKHSTSKTRFKGGGSGLGLALSKGIVEAHSGKIYVESPGYDEVNFPGSHFHVILPLSKLEPNEIPQTSQPIKFEIAA
ncbi:MAG: GAF domain-containing protein [Anaerolineales bacterium]|nr:GAF domain-containing protein [Anaerolineales bacterium]